MPKYHQWWQSVMVTINDTVKKGMDKLEAQFATANELNVTNSRLQDLESRFSQFNKKASSDIADLKSKFDIE